MVKIYTAILSLVCLSNLIGQKSINQYHNIKFENRQRSNPEAIIELKHSNNENLRAVSLRWTASKIIETPSFEISWLNSNKSWSKSEIFLPDHHYASDGHDGTMLPIYLPLESDSIRLTMNSKEQISIDVFVNIFTAVQDQEFVRQQAFKQQAGCFCSTLTFTDRKTWGCPQGPTTYNYSKVSHLIVHHAAGTNSSTDWASVVLSIWNFHTGTNGWADIGYNWLIDPNGMLYEGRGGGENAIGAHFCGKNTNTMGVCMLGNLSTIEPSAAAINTLAHILHWKSCDADIKPTETSYHPGSSTEINVISGHRDGCSTECPGNYMYPLLPAIRTKVQGLIDACKVSNYIETNHFDIEMYPNPLLSDILYFKGFDVKWVKVFAANGQLVSSKNDISNNVINLSTLPKGSYLIQAGDNKNEIKTGNLIRQ